MRKARSQTPVKAPREGRKPAKSQPKAGRRASGAVAAEESPAVPFTTTAGRTGRAAQRRQAILDAALTVFAARGYEAARLDDVAAQAGVAKGTLYLYFEDKQALFEALVRSAVSPILDTVGQALAAADAKTADILDFAFAAFHREVLSTRRRLLLRLIISEGPRFPELAAFYHREVVSRGMKLLGALARRAVERGEFPTDAAVRFPQLIMAPLLLAVIWDGLFSRIDPLDAAGLLSAHRQALTATPGGTAP
jgi:AcrR family transcriptional regulator